jgi:very-short-patch-repair endonuclease
MRLRNRQLGGFKFVRQEPIGDYFADFVCRDRKLVVEVDGATHGSSDEIARDEHRDERLVLHGYRVMRIANEDLRNNLDRVLDAILSELGGEHVSMSVEAAAPHPGPLPAGGERE